VTTQQNREIIRHGDFYPGRLADIKEVNSYIQESTDQSEIQAAEREILQTAFVGRNSEGVQCVSCYN
jgi:hypothetical protein